ncbi:AAA family ATPase [Candidatus Microgenomates bacterium]|nr:AAA family ATPase [Candidatus Microgenomates bacterium]
MIAQLKYRNIAISSKIGTGKTTLARHLEQALGWKRLEGGEIFWEPLRKKLNLSENETDRRPDEEDLKFDQALKERLNKEDHLIVETHLAGFDAQGIPGVFKILLVCEDAGKDQVAIRIDRIVNRNGTTVEEAKEHIESREKKDLEKWRRLYSQGDPDWTPFNPDYFDLVINTFNHNQEETLRLALESLGFKK